MKLKPIHFPAPVADDMVRAILDGRKTVTRRVVKPQPLWRKPPVQQEGYSEYWGNWDDEKFYKAPYLPGDVLYVRETWDNEPVTPDGHFRPNGVLYYKADGDIRPEAWRSKWRPSIQMPREAARIFLRVTDIRIERLQDTRCSGIVLEGVLTPPDKLFSTNEAMARMKEVWDSTIKPADRDLYGWDVNPWVWVIEFERCKKPKGIK